MAKKRSEGSSTNIIQLKKLLADLEKSILATKKQIVAEDKKSADYLEKMAKLDAIRSQNRNEYYRIRRQIDQIEKDSLKRAEKESKIKDDLAKKIQEENKQLEDIAKKQEAKLKRDEKAQKLREKQLQFEKEIGELQEKSAILMKSVNSDIQKKADKLKISGQFVTQIADKTDEIKKLFRGTKEETQAFEKTLRYTNDNASKIDKLSGKILENMENMKKKGYQLIDTYEIERDLKEQTARLDLNRSQMGEKRYSLQKKLIDAQKKEFEKLKEVNKKMAEKSKEAKETRENIVGWIAAVPLGAFLMNKMGLGKIITGTKTVKETIKDWGTALKGFAAALPFMALGGIFSLLVTVFKKLVGMVFELDQDLSDLSKQFAISRSRAEGLFGSLGKMALRMNVVGVNTKELAKTLEDLTEEYGTNLDRLESSSMKNGMLQGISLLREKWQLTNEEALNFYKNSNMMGVGMDKLAQASIMVNKNVLNAKQALKAVANIPQVIALGFKGSVRELAAFAGQAKIMGIDLKTFHDALKSAMDVESSLDTQFTAEVLTGVHHKQMDAYRDAAMKGEDDKAFKLKMEMYQDYIDKYGKNLKGMYVPYRETVAKLFGESEEDFVNGIARFGQLQEQFGKGSLKAIQKMQESNKKLVGKDGASGFLLGETQAREGASIQEKFNDDVEKIKIAIKDQLMPVLTDLHSLYGDIAKDMKGFAMDFAKSLPEFVQLTKDLLGTVKEIWGVVSGFLEMLGIVKTETDANGKSVKKFNAEWFNMTNILLTIVGFFGAKGLLTWAIGKTFEKMGSWIKGGAKSLKDFLFGTKEAAKEAVEEVGKKSTKVVKETAKTGTNLVDDAAKAGGAAMKGGRAKYSWKPPTSATSVVDDAAKAGKSTTGMGRIGKQYKVPVTQPKSGGMFSSIGSFFKNQFSKVTSVVDDAVKFASKTAPKTTAAFKTGGKFIGKAAVPLQVGLSAYDAYSGYGKAEETFKTKKATPRQKAASTFGAMIESNSLGILPGQKIAKWAYDRSQQGKFTPIPGFSMLNMIPDGENQTANNDYSKKLQSADKQRAATKQKTMNQFNNSGPTLFDSAWNSLFGVEQKTQPVKTTYQKPMSVTDNTAANQQKPVVVNVSTTALEQKIDKLVTIIGQMGAQPTYIKIGERTVEAIISEIDFKKNKEVGLQKYS